MIQVELHPNGNFKNLNKYADQLGKKIKTGVKRGMETVGMRLTAEIKKELTKKSVGSTKQRRYYDDRKPKWVWVSPSRPGTIWNVALYGVR